MRTRISYFIEYVPNENEGPQAQEVSRDDFFALLDDYFATNKEVSINNYCDGSVYLVDTDNYFY